MFNALQSKTASATAFLAFCAFLPAISFALSSGAFPQAADQLATPRVSSIEIVLPPRLIAGHPATLATLGADHRLLGHVPVEIANGTRLETDATGRVNFIAPAGAVLIAKSGGASAATLIDAPSAINAGAALTVPPFAALHNSLNICGSGFDGNAEANRVQIDDEPALVLAASPECLEVIPGPYAAPGVAKVSIDSVIPAERFSLTLVALSFESPQPPLMPGKKGWLTVRAHGSAEPLRIMVENKSFDVLQFDKGDVQELITSGGPQNVGQIRVQAIRSGDFSFHARILSPPDSEAARRFFQAAEPLALPDVAKSLKKMEDDLQHHPADAEKVRAELDRMLELTGPGDLRTLIEAARSAL
jgi:hypothetical protein